jgi:ring-1,2-phenylacetyl-CoA epoxidase subunit PaaC
VIRLGDGTAESHDRIKAVLSILWAYTDEFFIPAAFEVNLGIDFDILKKIWLEKVMAVLEEATLFIPENIVMQSGGKNGLHTSQLELILAEMQQLQRTYPGAEW